MTYTEGQLKLAREVMGNFEACISGGYWVHGIEGRDRDDDRNPGTLVLVEDDYGEAGDRNVVTDEEVCEAMEKIATRQYTDLRRDLFKTIRDMWEEEDYLGVDGPGGDFETDDVIVQLAVFGEVVYG